MFSRFRAILTTIAAIVATATVAAPCRAAGQIDASTLIAIPHGSYNGIAYTRYEAMFAGTTSNNRPYRVPCQIITPTNNTQGSRLLLFDWLVVSTAYTIVGQEQADARYTMKDDFLFGMGLSYATVRSDPYCIGKRSPINDPTRPWSDGALDNSSEFILSAGDEYDIVVDYVKALRTDPVALQALGVIQKRAAFGYSAGGGRLRGLLRLQMGEGLFDFSLVGGVGNGFTHPSGNDIKYSSAEKAPLPGAGLEIDFRTEFEIVASKGYKARHEEPNYRNYEFAGTAHIRDLDAFEFGLADPAKANRVEWTPFIRALFVAGIRWCDGIQPPPTVWLGALNDPQIARDAKGNALVRVVGGLPYNSTGYRFPEVAVGKDRYFAYDPTYVDGTFLGFFRSTGGGFEDLTGTFTDHADYVGQITAHARALQSGGYLLEADADAIILRAELSDIGNP